MLRFLSCLLASDVLYRNPSKWTSIRSDDPDHIARECVQGCTWMVLSSTIVSITMMLSIQSLHMIRTLTIIIDGTMSPIEMSYHQMLASWSTFASYSSERMSLMELRVYLQIQLRIMVSIYLYIRNNRSYNVHMIEMYWCLSVAEKEREIYLTQNLRQTRKLLKLLIGNEIDRIIAWMNPQNQVVYKIPDESTFRYASTLTNHALHQQVTHHTLVPVKFALGRSL